jgi:ribosomal protein S18 acetylase RimI-like enzyme
MNYKIEQMVSRDLSDIITLWDSTEGIGLHKADDDTIESLSKFLDHNPGLSFIAKWDNKIVGAVLCGYDGRRGYLHHLAVDKNYRKNGIGKELVNSCINALKELGIKKCNLFLFENNTEGEMFYHQIGWHTRSDLKTIQKAIPS